MLPIFHSTDRAMQLMQTSWASKINPLIDSPLSSPILLTDIALTSGNNVINHKLGRQPQGWIITDINGVSSIYRNAPFNNLTLTLNSSNSVSVNLMVF